MAITKNRLYGPDGATAVRSPRTAADKSGWLPDDRNVGEAGPDEVILDAREWETVNVYPDFRDISGDPHTGGSVDITPMISVPDSTGTAGRRWKLLTPISGLVGNAVSEVEITSHDCAFKITAVTLSGATDVVLKVTGGKERRERMS